MTKSKLPAPAFTYEEFTKRNIGFVTPAEQKILQESRILIIGVGGMGGTAFQCLVRSGVGRFIIADIDTFEISNLNRQIFSNLDNMGLEKADSAREAALKINPDCEIQLLGPEWLEKLDELLPQVAVVINGCDDVRATIELMRKAKAHGKTVIDAFASPLPSVYVVKPTDPRPEESFGYPTRGIPFAELTLEQARASAAKEIEFVLAQSSSARHVDLEIAAEMISGKRKRMSFAPMVWATGILMSYEAVRILLGKPGGPGNLGAFLNPWDQKFERAGRTPWTFVKTHLVRRFLKKMTASAGASTAVAVVMTASIFLSGCLETTASSKKTYLQQSNNAAEQKAWAESPAVNMLFGDFGGLNSETLQTNALPWKVVATYLVVKENRDHGLPLRQESLPKILQEYGFITPEKIENWPTNLPQPQMDLPVGLIHGVGHLRPLAALDISNINCTACHAGTTYDRHGLPTMNVWIGLPNTSINIQAYTQDVYAAMKEAIKSKSELLKNVKTVFPDVSTAELETMKLAFGTIAKKVKQLEATTDQPTAFSSGNPGVTNGVASLKRVLKSIDLNRYQGEETAFTAVPDLSNRFLRSSLLYDGVYSPKNQPAFAPFARATTPPSRIVDLAEIVGFFNVPVQGQTPQAAEKSLPQVRTALKFLEDYKAPKFPGEINEARAVKGQALFAQNCTQCHGQYEGELRNLQLTTFPNRLVSVGVIGTDPDRALLVDDKTADLIRKSKMGQHMQVNQSRGYVAPILSGLWATAPYLHNGSVPTLWQLMNPELRAKSFQVGGHALDFKEMGILGEKGSDGVSIYPSGYRAWSRPYMYQTSDKGRSNRGHEKPFARLTAEEKWYLIEFLKLL